MTSLRPKNDEINYKGSDVKTVYKYILGWAGFYFFASFLSGLGDIQRTFNTANILGTLMVSIVAGAICGSIHYAFSHKRKKK